MKMFKKSYLSLVALAILGLSFASANSYAIAAAQKIGVLDFGRVMSESKAAKAMERSLNNKYSKRRQAIINAQKNIQQQVNQLQRNAAVMQASKKEQLQREIGNKQRDVQRQQQDFQQDFVMDRNKAMEKFYKKLRVVINDYADKKGLDLVVHKEAVPFAKKEADITSDIIRLSSSVT